jgi:hypothetical protein
MSDRTFMDVKSSTSSLLEGATSTGDKAPTRVQRNTETTTYSRPTVPEHLYSHATGSGRRDVNAATWTHL